MKTLHQISVGELRLIIRSDGGVYIGAPDRHGVIASPIRVGESPAICSALADGFREIAEMHRKLVPKEVR